MTKNDERSTKNHGRTGRLALLTAALLAAGSACATEGGGSIYPHGAENYMAGALPPPGIYGLMYGQSYSADEVRDNDGRNVAPPGFKVRANALAARLAWVPDVRLLGGDLVLHTILPVVNLSVSAGGARQRKTGLGDITVGAGIGWHHDANWHSVAAIDVFLPTGSYRKGDLANIGRNHYAAQAVYAISRVSADGLNLDAKLHYLINGRNSDTGYRSGQQLHADYSIGWGVAPGWVLGVGGYGLIQTTDDRSRGAVVPSNKARAFSIGPSLKYDSGKGWFITAKWEEEAYVRNRAKGSGLWIKAVFPL